MKAALSVSIDFPLTLGGAKSETVSRLTVDIEGWDYGRELSIEQARLLLAQMAILITNPAQHEMLARSLVVEAPRRPARLKRVK